MSFKEYAEQIKQELTIEQVEELLAAMDGFPQRHGDIIISRTICHGGDSHKLYYYSNTHLFKCFTGCAGDSYDIYDLIIRINKTNGKEISLYQAIKYIIKFFNLRDFIENSSFDDNQLEDWEILNNYVNSSSQEKEEKKIIELKIYDEKILKYLPHPHILPWEEEGLTREAMEYCGICYDPVAQGIVIPHYDINNNLIGIRERTLIKENEEFGKYRPAIINYQMYNHPLGFTLYGLNWAKDNIKTLKKVIIFEGEKSVIKYMSWFGNNNSIAVAACGSNLTQYQINLLLQLGVEEIAIAFDRQFKKIGDEEWKIWTKKLTDLNNKYSKFVNISFLFDKNNLLDYKDSPIDKNEDTFLQLFNERVSL